MYDVLTHLIVALSFVLRSVLITYYSSIDWNYFSVGAVQTLKMEEINLDNSRTANSDSNLAVKITDAYKAYSASVVVLNGFNMNVKQGTM